MKTDLHCHTTVSDGSMTPAQLVAYAGRAGLDCIAVTDHDCLDGGIRAAGAAEEQHSRVKVIAGVELSTFDYKNGRRVHLLCYRPRRTKVLEEICRVTCESRLKAAMEMLEMISPRYPVDLETVRAFSPGSSSVFKQHIALALMHMGYDIQLYGSLFDSLFSRSHGMASVEPHYPETREVLEAAAGSGGVCVLAHPGVYRNFDVVAELCGLGLQGIEAQHPRQSAEDCARAAQAAAQKGLIPTGGSDFHGAYSKIVNPIGARTAPDGTLERLEHLFL